MSATAPAPKKTSAKSAAKAAKAERRAAAKGFSGPAGSQPGPGSVDESREDGVGTQQKKASSAGVLDPLQLFLHLDVPKASSSLSHTTRASTTNIHPSILKLALMYSEFRIVGANARCISMLQAFKDLVVSYAPPPQTLIARHLPTSYLNPQIAHLIRARPLSVSMGTAIRYLKYEISLIHPDTSLDDAKTLLLGKIDSFIRDRILLADKVIEQYAITKINNGDTILTYARSSVVEGVLLEAKKQGRDFSVVVVDSRPLLEGKNLLASLTSAGIPTTYVLLSQLSSVNPKNISLCLLGTHSVLSNGSMFARAGTAMVAMVMKVTGVPVVCCCETYKFSERVMLDSIVGNEMTLSDTLIADLSRPLPDKLLPLSLLYDVSRPEDVTAVITEAGFIPVQSVPVIIREYKPLIKQNSVK